MSGPKIPEAYSNEYEDIIDAEKAYELYWDGEITDKRKFQCKNDNCYAQITCANIDKERVLMKKKPYFLLVGKHSCVLDSDLEELNVLNSDELAIEGRYIDDEKDILISSEERKGRESRKKLTPVDETEDFDRVRKKKSESKNRGKRNSEYKTIAPLVSKYLKYSEDNALETKKIAFDGKEITYKEFFVEIDDYSCNYFIKDSRIYFGNATIVKAPKNQNEFIVKFKKNVKFRGLIRLPSIYISNSILDDSSRKINWRKKLEFYSENDVDIKLFICGHLKLIENEYYENDGVTLKSKYYGINIILNENDLRFWDIREV